MVFKRLVIIICMALAFATCNSKQSLDNISGDDQSIRIAEKMMEKMGGVSRWRSLKSIAIHTALNEGGRNYEVNEVYNLTNDAMLIEYDFPEGKLTREIKGDSAWVIKNDSSSLLDKTNADFLRYWRDLSFYYKIRDLVTDTLFVKYTNQNHLMFMSSDRKEYKFGFLLNKDLTPNIFYRPKFNNQDISLKLSDWTEVQGYMIPFKGESMDKSYIFEVKDIIINE